jgi:putative membrane protein
MERRLVVAGLLAAAAAPAFAQAPARPAGADALSQAEQDHMKKTMTIGAMALATSRIAVQKAQDPKVKQFAQFEVAEQETMADVLKSMQDPARASGDVKKPSEDEVKQNLDAKGQEAVQKMQQAQAGPAFDAEYLRGQVEGHKMLLDVQEAYLKSGKNVAHLGATKLARGQIKEHLQILADLQKGAQSTTGSGAKR